MNATMKSEHYSFLKVVLTILVVIGHSTRMYTDNSIIPLENNSAILRFVSHAIYSFHMPLFIALSGMIFGLCHDDLKKYGGGYNGSGYSGLVVKKIKRLMIPYTFFGIYYVTPVMIFLGLTEDAYLQYIIKNILLGYNPRHLWYLFVLFEIYIVCIFGLKMIDLLKVKSNTTILVLIGILTLAMFFFSERITAYFQLCNFCNYAVFFFLGYLYNKKYDCVNRLLEKLICIVLLLIASVLMLKIRHYKLIGFMLTISVSLLMLFITREMDKIFPKGKAFDLVSKNGFGIYLFHPMIIYILYYFFDSYYIPPVILCIVITIIAYFSSMGATFLVRKAKLQTFIGE